MFSRVLREAREAFGDSATVLIKWLLDSQLFQSMWEAARPGRGRPPILTHPCLVGLGILAALRGDLSYVQILLAAWPLTSAALWGQPTPPVTEAAYCTARRRFSVRPWKVIFERLVQAFADRFGALMRWKGFRLVAVDSTTIEMGPHPKLLRHFGAPKNNHGAGARPQGRLSVLYNVLTGVPLRWVLTAYETSERWAAFYLMKFLRPGDLLLADANYKGFQFFCTLLDRQVQFLVRFVHEAQYGYRRIKALGPGDFLVEVPRPKNLPKKLREELPEKLILRLIEVQAPGFRPSSLLTFLLDSQEFPADEIRALYYGRIGRWAIETFYRDIKHTALQIEALRSRSVAGIFAEVYAIMSMVVMARTLMTEAAQGAGKPPMNLSLGKTLLLLEQAMPALLAAPQEQRPLLYEFLLRQIATLEIDIRPGRRFARPGDTKPKNKGKGKWRAPRIVARSP